MRDTQALKEGIKTATLNPFVLFETKHIMPDKAQFLMWEPLPPANSEKAKQANAEDDRSWP
ncbi:MAG: hypothetical protein EAZ34_09630 [Polaromonas sp.]|nr:MAG: hypothetical protein EAZ34_09630 [Polaromonas sp.]